MTTDDEARRERFDKLSAAKERWAAEGRGMSGDDGARARDRLPPGQRLTRDFPVLDLGVVPRVDPRDWALTVGGLVANPLRWSWEDLMAQPQTELVTDIHCVTTWSAYDLHWGGVPFCELLARVEPTEHARYVLLRSADDYTTNLPLDELLHDAVLLADELEGAPLPTEHGGPVRLLVPHLYGWKSAKWLTGIEFRETDAPGFWEERGYHDRGDPWREERYR